MKKSCPALMLVLCCALVLGATGCGGTATTTTVAAAATTATTAATTTTTAAATTTTMEAETTTTVAAETTTTVAVTLSLAAPNEVIDLWNSWNGKYVLYARRDAGIQNFSDLDGMDLLVAQIDVDFDTVMGDASAFLAAGKIKMNIGLQNNVSAYKTDVPAKPSSVGFMVPEVAATCGFDGNDSLVRIELKPTN